MTRLNAQQAAAIAKEFNDLGLDAHVTYTQTCDSTENETTGKVTYGPIYDVFTVQLTTGERYLEPVKSVAAEAKRINKRLKAAAKVRALSRAADAHRRAYDES